MDRNRLEASEGPQVSSNLNGLDCLTPENAPLKGKGNFQDCLTPQGFSRERRHDKGPLDTLPRWQRKSALAKEIKARKFGIWPAWVAHPLIQGQVCKSGWARDFHTAHVNEIFTVLERKAEAGITHLMISSLSGDRPSWWEAQRIKNEIAGRGATAVEVYPPQSEVVDDADAYHLWVIPAPFPASLFERPSPSDAESV